MFSFLAPFKMYFYAAAIAAIVGAVYWFNGVLDERTELREEVKAKNIAIAIKDSQIADAAQQTKDTAEFMKIQEIENAKSKKLSDCVASRTCRIKLLGASCPKASDDDIAGSEPSSPRLDENMERHILYLRDSIKYNKRLFAARDKQLKECAGEKQ